jgi:hypothetical protein
MIDQRNRKCVLRTSFTKPTLAWRWYRRFVFYVLNRRIDRLASSVRKLAKRSDPNHEPFVVYEDKIDVTVDAKARKGRKAA